MFDIGENCALCNKEYEPFDDRAGCKPITKIQVFQFYFKMDGLDSMDKG